MTGAGVAIAIASIVKDDIELNNLSTELFGSPLDVGSQMDYTITGDRLSSPNVFVFCMVEAYEGGVKTFLPVIELIVDRVFNDDGTVKIDEIDEIKTEKRLHDVDTFVYKMIDTLRDGVLSGIEYGGVFETGYVLDSYDKGTPLFDGASDIFTSVKITLTKKNCILGE